MVKNGADFELNGWYEFDEYATKVFECPIWIKRDGSMVDLPRGGVDLADGTRFEAWWAWPNGVCYISAATQNDCPYPGDLSESWDINVICSHHQFTQGSGDSQRKYGEGSQTGHHIGM